MNKSTLFSASLYSLKILLFPFAFLILSGISFLQPTDANAQGNLLIMPRRVVFEGSKKSQELTLANTGSDTAKYVVSVVQMRMKEDGSFELITAPDSGQMFADKYFRFFPRQVELPPNQSQVVKMQLNKSSKMAPGEYRSHIYFRAVKKETPLGEDNKQRDSTAVSVKLSPVFGITIPAIIRVGEATGKITISNISVDQINDTIPRLSLNFSRSGNSSVYGDISVTHTAIDGKVNKVAIVKGVAVYTPNILRKFQCNLDKNLGIDYRKGKLTILYSAAEDVKSAKLAEAEFQLH